MRQKHTIGNCIATRIYETWEQCLSLFSVHTYSQGLISPFVSNLSHIYLMTINMYSNIWFDTVPYIFEKIFACYVIICIGLCIYNSNYQYEFILLKIALIHINEDESIIALFCALQLLPYLENQYWSLIVMCLDSVCVWICAHSSGFM